MPAPMLASDVMRSCILDRIVEGTGVHCQGTLIGLHDENSTPLELLPFLRLIVERRLLVAPRSARWSSFQAGGKFSWFSSVSPPWIEPIGFGDGLMQLETLLFDYADGSTARDIAVVGKGQGATMAVALAALWPELVDVVVAIGGAWPHVPGWALPQRDLSGVRALIIDGGDLAGDKLASWGANVNEVVSNAASDNALSKRVKQWFKDNSGTGARVTL